MKVMHSGILQLFTSNSTHFNMLQVHVEGSVSRRTDHTVNTHTHRALMLTVMLAVLLPTAPTTAPSFSPGKCSQYIP